MRNSGDAANGSKRMSAQTSRRSFVAGMAATAAAGTLLPVATIARDAGGASEGLAYREAGDLVKALADRQVSSRELVNDTISRIEALDPKINAVGGPLAIAIDGNAVVIADRGRPRARRQTRPTSRRECET